MLEMAPDIPVTGSITFYPIPYPPDISLVLTYDSPFDEERFGDNISPGEFQEMMDLDDVELFTWEGLIAGIDATEPKWEVCQCIVEESMPGTLPPPNW